MAIPHWVAHSPLIQNHIDPLAHIHYRTRVTDSVDSPESPYRAPEASLDRPDQPVAISEKAMQSLVSSKLWMRIAAIALMMNGGLTAATALYLGWVSLAAREPLPGRGFAFIILMLLLGFRLFHPGLLLLQSSMAVTRAALSREERDIAFALRRHQQFWKSLGIAFVLILLALTLILITAIR